MLERVRIVQSVKLLTTGWMSSNFTLCHQPWSSPVLSSGYQGLFPWG